MKSWSKTVLGTVGFLLAAAPAWAGGAVSGLVWYQGVASSLKKHPITIDNEVCGSEATDEDFILGKKGVLKNAVVYVQGRVEGALPFPAPQGGFTLHQKGCRFEPHVLVVGAGADISILNSDHLNHSLKTVSRTNAPQEIAQPKSSELSMIRIDHPEAVELRCAIHTWMKAWIVVAEHPYYAVTDANGRFEIKDIPAGDYTLSLWHEALGLQTRHVQVREGESLKLDWSIRPANAYSTPQEPWISQTAARLDVNILPVQFVQWTR